MTVLPTPLSPNTWLVLLGATANPSNATFVDYYAAVCVAIGTCYCAIDCSTSFTNCFIRSTCRLASSARFHASPPAGAPPVAPPPSKRALGACATASSPSPFAGGAYPESPRVGPASPASRGFSFSYVPATAGVGSVWGSTPFAYPGGSAVRYCLSYSGRGGVGFARVSGSGGAWPSSKRSSVSASSDGAAR